jgi:hypothetical protein
VSSCTTGTVPHGPCIQETTNDGSSWGNLTNDPGADQIYMDVASNTLFALGRDNNISYTTNDSSWTELSLDICDSEDTILPDLIAVTSGMLMALNHNGGDPGYPYYFRWNVLDPVWNEDLRESLRFAELTVLLNGRFERKPMDNAVRGRLSGRWARPLRL